MERRYNNEYGFAFVPRPVHRVPAYYDGFGKREGTRSGPFGLPFRVIVESTPETLERIDKLTDQVVIANKTAMFAVGAVMILGVTVILSRSTERVRVRRAS